MSKLMDYLLLAETNSAVLSKKVTEYLNKGWVLYGSPMVAFGYGESLFHYQAVIRKEPKGE